MMMKQHLRLLAVAAAVMALISASGCSKTPATSAAQPAAMSTPASSATQVSDVDVTEHVTTALQQSALLKGVEIAVVTTKGDVRLTAVLDNQAQIDDALRIARAADGAHSIHDELTLRK